MKPVKASATPSTSDAVSRRRHIRSLDELTMSFRPLEPMSYNLIESTQDSSVKGQCACPRPAASFAAHAPHASGCQECKFANYPVFRRTGAGTVAREEFGSHRPDKCGDSAMADAAQRQ